MILTLESKVIPAFTEVFFTQNVRISS